MKNINLKRIVWIALIISVIPIIFYLLKFGSLRFSSIKSDWGSFGDYIGGLLNPFISFLTLLVTIYIAISLNQYEEEKNKKLKAQEDVKTYLELYQYFTGPEFREKRVISWEVMRKAIAHPDYADFLIEGNFISRYTNRQFKRKYIYEKFKHIFYANKNLTQEEFLLKESEDRHKLESLIDFFQLLAIRDVPNDNYKVCDFYYDNWRPVLCWYAKKLEIFYTKHEENVKFNTPPNLRDAIKILDNKYCTPQAELLSIDNILEHPILKWYSQEKSND